MVARSRYDALIGDQPTRKGEDGDGRNSKGLAGGRAPQQWTEVGPQKVELGDDRVVIRHVHGHVLVSLVRERLSLGPVIGEDGLLTDMDLAGGHDLVSGLAGKGGDGAIKLPVDLGGKVFDQQRQSDLAEFRRDQ